MYILTNENKTYNLDRVPNEIDDIRYGVLDCSDASRIDYYFLPLIFLESFYSPVIVLKLGEYKTQMPLDWSILVCDENYSDLEIMPLTSLNDRGFRTLVYNPLKPLIPDIVEVEIENVYAEVKWFFPKLKSGNVLVVPLEEKKERPMCSLFVKDNAKISEPIDISELF